MKSLPHFAALMCALFFASNMSIFAQGSIVPTAAPNVPIMKTLDQVEPRIVINATNTPGNSNNQFIISQSGSYYLTGNITGVSGKNGILINAINVSLDLSGFEMVACSTARSGHGAAGASRSVIRSTPLSRI